MTEGPARSRPSGPRRRRLLVTVSAVVLVLVGGALVAALSESATNPSSPLVDQTDGPAPAFVLPDLLVPARSISDADFRGKDLVVNFWASWCYPCQTEMPLLESAFRSEHGRVAFLGIDSNDTPGAAVAFLAKVHVTYPAASDGHGHVASVFGLFGLPTTVFISSSGRMRGRHIGQLDAATLRAALHEAFGVQGAS